MRCCNSERIHVVKNFRKGIFIVTVVALIVIVVAFELLFVDKLP